MVRNRGCSCFVDGRVDRMPEDQAQTRITHIQDTIAWMNVWLQTDNPTVFYDPASDLYNPEALLYALATNTGQPGSPAYS
jgi:hypothetical protein